MVGARLAGITTMEAANRWLAEFLLPCFNARFAVRAAKPGSTFMAERAAALGQHALARLGEIARSRRCIGEVRGLGLLIGVELIHAVGVPAPALAEGVLYAALSPGLSLKTTMGSVLTLSPPLIIDRCDLDRALDTLAESIDAAEAGG